jgi:conjugal transfer pilus assembly protein TraV
MSSGIRLAHVSQLVSAVAMLSGCTSMSGLSGSSSYACKAPDGVTCDSVSGTYANAMHNNLPSQRARVPAPLRHADERRLAPPGRPASSPLPAVPATASASPIPLRSSARILRLWFKPWEDADRDLYDQGYVYVQIDSGQWLVEHAQRQIRDAYAPLRPPPRPSAGEPRDGTALPANTRSAPRLPSAENPLPGLVSPTHPDQSD